ncbi:hypothetical protein [Mesoflavibacter zeaxanthinifaciens]|uniref:hypothetical protein n=1 Tax=Mesoflavibacter zeaxanthinifaciens TaxID=393060 RepID=UPI00041665C4|nr:hypothetical protein [Mesoflavibacter zeaxanthinifaciens]
MKLNHLYSLRKNFIIIGLTGRTGSGCTAIAKLLSGSFESIKESGLREFNDSRTLKSTFFRKYTIIKNYIENKNNWVPFDVISYKNVLLLVLINKYGKEISNIKSLLSKYFKESLSEDNTLVIANLIKELEPLISTNSNLINRIVTLNKLKNIKLEKDLIELESIFFGDEFDEFSKTFFKILQSQGYYRKTNFLHNIARNIRNGGELFGNAKRSIENIFELSSVINRIIKAKKFVNDKNPTRIVIDSLRNSLEIMFFKERYSGFYMVATKDVLDNSEDRVLDRLSTTINDVEERKRIAKKLFDLDATEYRTKDFSKGIFSSPDVENCIQKSDYHLLNLKKKDVTKFLKIYDPPYGRANFLTREEQLVKLIALISQPGLVTPTSVERSMQVAATAKINSGCISRNVGAAITNSSFYVKSIGWNDVAKGHTPCNLRNVEDIISPPSEEWFNETEHYSPFEKGKVSNNSSFKYKNETPGDFKEALVEYFSEPLSLKKEDLNGKHCAFCFKTVHNHYEGEVNQVHTRSLHAEENAMLQITKLGGQGVENGILFTTASPCELCSKKAYQLGIRTIYFIDPYPGISNDQILKGGSIKTQPKMIPFSGAIGVAYNKCYDSFMSYKDEVTMTLEMEVDNKIAIQFKELLKSIKKKDVKIGELLNKSYEFNDDDIVTMMSKVLRGFEK